MKCKWCKYWTKYFRGGYGSCQSEKFVDCIYSQVGDLESDALAILFPETEPYHFVTGPEFGCVHFIHFIQRGGEDNANVP